MIEANLHLVAKSRVLDPLNTWPDHIRRHRITIMGNWLFDHDCLRCWLEQVATEIASAPMSLPPELEAHFDWLKSK